MGHEQELQASKNSWRCWLRCKKDAWVCGLRLVCQGNHAPLSFSFAQPHLALDSIHCLSATDSNCKSKNKYNLYHFVTFNPVLSWCRSWECHNRDRRSWMNFKVALSIIKFWFPSLMRKSRGPFNLILIYLSSKDIFGQRPWRLRPGVGVIVGNWAAELFLQSILTIRFFVSRW